MNAIGKSISALLCDRYDAGVARATRIDRLKSAMEQADLDQSALAAAVGCTQGAISQILLGKTKRSKYLIDIAQALNVALAWLYGETDDPTVKGPNSAHWPPKVETITKLLEAAQLGGHRGRASKGTLLAASRAIEVGLQQLADDPSIEDDDGRLAVVLNVVSRSVQRAMKEITAQTLSTPNHSSDTRENSQP